MKGKKCIQELVEFGEKVHYRYKKKAKSKDEKLEVNWSEGYFLGKWWRTREAVIGTEGGILRAGTIRRVGAHRRWDREGLEKVRGVPWQWNPDEGEVHADLKVRWLTEEERASGEALRGENSTRLYRLRLRKADFLTHGFSEGCPGCQALIAGTPARGHSERCRTRMCEAMKETDDGRERKERQLEKENEVIAGKLEEEYGEADAERRSKKARVEEGGGSSSPQGPMDMEVSLVERVMQEDMRWRIGAVSDMCMPEEEELMRSRVDMEYFDENTWEALDAENVMEGERVELDRFGKMGVYDYASRAQALSDPEGKFVKVKWVRTNKDSSKEQVVRCRLVAQELGYGEKMDELFAGTPSLMTVKLVLVHAAQGGCRGT